MSKFNVGDVIANKDNNTFIVREIVPEFLILGCLVGPSYTVEKCMKNANGQFEGQGEFRQVFVDGQGDGNVLLESMFTKAQ